MVQMTSLLVAKLVVAIACPFFLGPKGGDMSNIQATAVRACEGSPRQAMQCTQLWLPCSITDL